VTIDLTPLERAISQLERSLGYIDSDLARRDLGLQEQFRMAAIQAFEFTYELSWRALKRYLDISAASPTELDALTFKNWFRMGAEKGLISNPEAGFGYREKRNLTAHAYDEAKAQAVLSALPAFARDARDLLRRLEER